MKVYRRYKYRHYPSIKIECFQKKLLACVNRRIIAFFNLLIVIVSISVNIIVLWFP